LIADKDWTDVNFSDLHALLPTPPPALVVIDMGLLALLNA
jgi:hypothetical protein